MAELEPELPVSANNRAVLFGAAILLLAGLVGAVWLVSSDGTASPATTPSPEAPEPAEAPADLPPAPPITEAPAAPQTVTVTLTSVPEGSSISLDAEPWLRGSEVSVPRDGHSHIIEVSLDDGRSWRQEVTASEDTSYQVDLPRRARRRSRGRARPRGGLIRDPGF